MSQTVRAPRIPPVQPPYEPDLEASLMKWMPPGAEVDPLNIFRTFHVHPELASRIRPLGAGILAHGLVEPREREIVILRSCARAGAEYEWGVHVSGFAAAVGLTNSEVNATLAPGSGSFTLERDRLLVDLVDELHESCNVTDELWDGLAGHYENDVLLELIVTACWYRLISCVINAAGVQHEPWATRFPAEQASAA